MLAVDVDAAIEAGTDIDLVDQRREQEHIGTRDDLQRLPCAPATIRAAELAKADIASGLFHQVATRHMFEMLMKLPLETRGFAPSTSRASVLAMSGIGWIVDEPNTASLPANLFAQSCVPDEK